MNGIVITRKNRSRSAARTHKELHWRVLLGDTVYRGKEDRVCYGLLRVRWSASRQAWTTDAPRKRRRS